MIIASSFNGSLSNFSNRWWTIYFKYKYPNTSDKLFWNCRLSTDIIICQVVLLCAVFYTELPFTFCYCILGFEIIISCDSLFVEWHIWIKKVRFKPLHQHTSWLAPWAQNLRQGIVIKTSFETRVSQMGLGSFVDINIFVMKYYIIQFLHILLFFEPLKLKSA